MNYVKFAATCVVFSTLTACVKNDTQRTQMEGATAGALIGALAGVIAGDDKKSAAIGALIGAAAGYAYGDHVAGKKKEFADQEDYYAAIISESEKLLSSAQAERKLIESRLKENRSLLATLKKQTKQTKQQFQQAGKVTRQLSSDIEATRQLIVRVEQEIQVQERVLQQEAKTMPVKFSNEGAEGIAELKTEQARLENLKHQLAALDTSRMH